MTTETPPLGIAVPYADVPAFLLEQRRPIDTLTAAGLLGVEPATIRDWKRRGLVQPKGRNRWDVADLLRARRMPRPRRSRDDATYPEAWDGQEDGGPRGRPGIDESAVRVSQLSAPPVPRDTPGGTVPLDTVVDRDHTFCLEGSAQTADLDEARALGKAAGPRHIQP